MKNTNVNQSSENTNPRRAKAISFAFTVAYATFLSLGFTCFINMLVLALVAAVFDGPRVFWEYPRFAPFCLITGLLSLVALIATFVLNLKVAKKIEFRKKTRWLRIIGPILLSIPFTVFWAILIAVLRDVL
jgi:hypothetical protein